MNQGKIKRRLSYYSKRSNTKIRKQKNRRNHTSRNTKSLERCFFHTKRKNGASMNRNPSEESVIYVQTYYNNTCPLIDLTQSVTSLAANNKINSSTKIEGKENTSSNNNSNTTHETNLEKNLILSFPVRTPHVVNSVSK